MNNVDPPVQAGQQPARPLDAQAWAAETRALVNVLRDLAFDGVAPRGQRRHSRTYLRRMLRNRLHTLDARIDLIAQPTSGASNSTT